MKVIRYITSILIAGASIGLLVKLIHDLVVYKFWDIGRMVFPNSSVFWYSKGGYTNLLIYMTAILIFALLSYLLLPRKKHEGITRNR